MGLPLLLLPMIVDVTNQIHLEMMYSNNLLKVIELILGKMKKYEELGRLDKSFLILGYLNKIMLFVKYWYYSKLPYSQLPKCLEESLECSLQELKDKLKILPREVYVDITQLLTQIQVLEEGISNIQILDTQLNMYSPLSDFQVV